jgi:hypothetical protein
MRSVRTLTSPRLLFPSSVDLPPVEFCLGTSPSQAASSRPFFKAWMSPIAASRTVAVIGPMPNRSVKEPSRFFIR